MSCYLGSILGIIELRRAVDAEVFYGFPLYLSLSRPMRAWRYSWLLIPLQLYALLDWLNAGIARIVELVHWLTDALGAYLEGALYLLAIIFLCRLATLKMEERRTRSLAGL